MRRLSAARYAEARKWILRNARGVERAAFREAFDGGPADAVAEALEPFQNPDGGFGHALEADNWNPASTPATTVYAAEILRAAGLLRAEQPLVKGVARYFGQNAPFLPYGWPFCVPMDDDIPHAPWWGYDLSANPTEHFGITAAACALALEAGEPGGSFRARAEALIPGLLEAIEPGKDLGDMGLTGLCTLLKTLRQVGRADEGAEARLREAVNARIERVPERWRQYTPAPSWFIDGPDSPFLAGNEDLMEAELDMIVDALPEGDVWPLTWTWFELTEKYAAAFPVAQLWWKAAKALEKLRLLRAFGRIEGQ